MSKASLSRLALFLSALGLSTSVSLAQTSTVSKPAAVSRSTSSSHSSPRRVTISSDRLARIDRVLQQYVDENKIAGAVALVLKDGMPVYEHAFGWTDKESGRRMQPDSIFRIASQS